MNSLQAKAFSMNRHAPSTPSVRAARATERARRAWRRAAALAALAVAATLAGCAVVKVDEAGAPQRYRCDNGLRFGVSFANDAARLTGARGDDVLLRDAGGQGAQTVYSNPRLRAEFGLGASGREAALHYLQPPLSTRCQRD